MTDDRKQRYRRSPKGRAKQAAYIKEYRQRPEVKERRRQRERMPEYVEKRRAYQHRPEVKHRVKLRRCGL